MELPGYNSGFTERVGYIVYGAYNFATVIVLLNMLIAMMSRTFGKIKVGIHSKQKVGQSWSTLVKWVLRMSRTYSSS